METEYHLLLTLSASLDIPTRTLKRHGDAWCIDGRHATIETDSASWFVLLRCKSKRAWSAAKRKLGFMLLIDDLIDGGRFVLDRMPSAQEASVVRKVAGLKKKPNLS